MRTGDDQIVAVNSYTEPMVSMVSLFGTTIPASGIAVNFTSTSTAGATGFSLTKSGETTNSQGLADVQLKLGNIPAEYSVTATCPNCEPSASSVTFTCCGKLPNDDFKQFDVKWADIPYDNICSTVPPGMGYRPVFSCDDNIFRTMPKYRFSIRSKGCALSALATLINYYRDAYNLSISSVTPEILNDFLNTNTYYMNACYSGKGEVNFECISLYDKDVKYVDKKDVGKFSREELISFAMTDVANSLPVILKISNPTHFILAIGKCGDKFIISDPGASNLNDVLYDPNGTRPLIGIRRFKYVKQ